MSILRVSGAIGILVCGALMYCYSSDKQREAQKVPLIQPPVSREQVRNELSQFPIPPEIGLRNDSLFEIDEEESASLQLLYFFDYVSWHCLTDTGEIYVGAYHPSSVEIQIGLLRGKDRIRFFGRDATRENRDELLRLKKGDSELDRTAMDYAQNHCPWFNTLNERCFTKGAFIPTNTREVWFVQQSGGVWCSSMCRVGVEFVTGRVVFYQQYYSPCSVPTKPLLHNAEEAAISGLANLHCKLGIYNSLASLGIQPEHRPYGDEVPVVTGLDALGCQRLAWYVMVEGGNNRKDGGCGFLLVDDRSGEVLKMTGLLQDPFRPEQWKTIPENPEPTIEKLPVLIDGRSIPVLFPPIKKGHAIYLFVDCLKPWDIVSKKENGTLSLFARDGKELLHTSDYWDRRGLIYLPIERVEPLLKEKISIIWEKGKPTVSFVLPR